MIRVLAATAALIQDSGRHGHAHIGVPSSGAFNMAAYTQACHLLDLPGTAPAFEILAGAFTVRPSRDVIAAVIGEATVHVNGSSVSAGHTFLAHAGTDITVCANAAHRGPVYLAIRGMHAPLTLDSASRDTLSRLGAPPLAAGDAFPLDDEPARIDLLGRFTTVRPSAPPRVLRMITGPHPLTSPSTPWTVADVSRSGVRLAGNLEHSPDPADSLPSFPVLPGTVQLPPSGQPIILGPDCGVTGGYPVIGVLINADRPQLARLQPGDPIVLTTVTLDTAAAVSAARTAQHTFIDINDLDGAH
jgi:allophanate hydrolase subunit 2